MTKQNAPSTTGGSTSESTKSSFAVALEAALEKAKQQNKGKSLDQLEIEREQRQHKK